MKIIFESQKEKLDFVQSHCPDQKNQTFCDGELTCETCWEKRYPGVMEVKAQKNSCPNCPHKNAWNIGGPFL